MEVGFAFHVNNEEVLLNASGGVGEQKWNTADIMGSLWVVRIPMLLFIPAMVGVLSVCQISLFLQLSFFGQFTAQRVLDGRSYIWWKEYPATITRCVRMSPTNFNFKTTSIVPRVGVVDT